MKDNSPWWRTGVRLAALSTALSAALLLLVLLLLYSTGSSPDEMQPYLRIFSFLIPILLFNLMLIGWGIFRSKRDPSASK